MSIDRRLLAATICVALVSSGCGSSASEAEVETVPVGQLEPGTTANLFFWAHCGVAHLGREIAGTFWTAENAGGGVDWMPPGWAQLVDDTEHIELQLALIEPDYLEVSATGSNAPIAYIPTNERVECD